MPTSTRWAMVGTGFMLDLIGHDLTITENVEPTVLVSRTRERADEAAARHGFSEGSDDLEAVLARDDIDVVYVATPHSLHFDQARAAILAGKHVLVEKSMTTSAAATEALCALAREHGVFAMEAMWTAFNPAIIELRRRVAAGEIGDVHTVHANFCSVVPYSASHRMWAPDLAGGSTLDQGVYTLSLAHMLLGTPRAIAVASTIEHGVDAEVGVTMDYASGARALCLSGLRSHSPLSAFVGGSDGFIEVPGPFWTPSGFVHRRGVGTAGASTDEFSYTREGLGYVPMLRAVSEAVLAGQTEHPLRTHADTLDVATTMDEVLRQAHRR